MKSKPRAIAFALATLIMVLASVYRLHSTLSDVYIAQNAAGSGNGQDCADAFAATYFNSSGNWGSGGIGAGTTVHLCGTFTGGAGTSGLLTVHGSGSSGSPIRIQFESGANATAPYWGTGGFITDGGNAFLQIDGSPSSTPCGFVNNADIACNGTISASANGAALANHVANGHAINLTGHNIEIRNIACMNLFVPVINSSNNEGSNGPNNTSCVWWLASSGGGNINSHNLQIKNSWNGVLYAYEGSNSNMFSNNNWCDTVENCTQIGAGGSGASINTGSWSNNDASNMAPWDTPGDRNHHEFIHLYTQQPSSTISNFVLAGNYLHGTLGAFMTAEIYVECDGGAMCPAPGGLQVVEFNNRIVNTDPNADISTGAGGNGMNECEGSTCQIYNNTYYSDNHYSSDNFAQHCEAGSNVTLKNNIFDGMNQGPANGGCTISGNNNVGYNLNVACGSICSVSTNPLLSLSSNPLYQLGAGSSAIGAGVNLSSLGIAGLGLDLLGNARPGGSTAWDDGVFNGTGGGGGAVILTPSSQGFGSAFVGVASANQTFTLTNTTASTDTSIAVSTTGGNSGDFARSSGSPGTCTTSLAAGSNCTINMVMTPSAAGTRSTTMSVAGSSVGSPQTASLSGTGLATSVTVSPLSLAFGSVLQGTTSATMNVTVTNTSGGTITIGTISATSSVDSDFARSSGSPGSCGGTLTNTSSCTVGVTFSPTGTPVLNETGTLSIAYTGFTGSPLTVSLTGTSTSVTPPAAPTSLNCTVTCP